MIFFIRICLKIFSDAPIWSTRTTALVFSWIAKHPWVVKLFAHHLELLRWRNYVFMIRTAGINRQTLTQTDKNFVDFAETSIFRRLYPLQTLRLRQKLDNWPRLLLLFQFGHRFGLVYAFNVRGTFGLLGFNGGKDCRFFRTIVGVWAHFKVVPESQEVARVAILTLIFDCVGHWIILRIYLPLVFVIALNRAFGCLCVFRLNRLHNEWRCGLSLEVVEDISLYVVRIKFDALFPLLVKVRLSMIVQQVLATALKQARWMLPMGLVVDSANWRE